MQPAVARLVGVERQPRRSGGEARSRQVLLEHESPEDGEVYRTPVFVSEHRIDQVTAGVRGHGANLRDIAEVGKRVIDAAKLAKQLNDEGRSQEEMLAEVQEQTLQTGGGRAVPPLSDKWNRVQNEVYLPVLISPETGRVKINYRELPNHGHYRVSFGR